MCEIVGVDQALRVAAALLIGDKYRRQSYTPQRGLFARGEVDDPSTVHDDFIRGVVIPDVRFGNELEAIRAAGGRIWHPPGPGSLEDSAPAAHPGETSLGADADAHALIPPFPPDHPPNHLVSHPTPS